MPYRSTAIVPLGAIAACAAMVMAPAAAVDTPPGVSLLYQSDAAYDPATAQRFAQANPRDLLFRVMGPQTPNSMGVADIVGFVGGLGNWTGRLWFSADATKSAFDKGYWGNRYSSSDSYKAYVDYLVTVNGALTAGWLAAVAIACFAAGRRWTLKAGVVVAAACLSALPGAVRASDPKPFAYFIDTVTDANISRTPATCAVIGEIGPGTNVGQRGHYTASGRVVGVSAAFYAELNLWTHAVAADPAKGITAQPSLQSIFSGTVDVGSPTARTALARQILDSTLQYPTEIPAPAEAEPTSAGGYVLWAQDFEMSAGGDSPAQMAAAITAISWAARQVSGSGTLFVPVPSSSIQKTASATWQLADVLTSGTMLGQLDLPSTMPSGDRGNLASMDLLSMLRLVHNGDTNAPLLDGFLAQQYQAGVIGTFPADEVAFYDQTLPYAIMSAHDNPRQLPSLPPVSPYPSYYSGSMPFLAGVYWHQDSIDDASAFDPSAYLRPEQRSLALVVPEPNAAMLLLVGLVGLAGIRPAVTRRTRRPPAVAAVVACRQRCFSRT